ncbi:MAG: hypothetical protein ACYDDF_05290 [Thermoplasmatota archaeon]
MTQATNPTHTESTTPAHPPENATPADRPRRETRGERLTRKLKGWGIPVAVATAVCLVPAVMWGTFLAVFARPAILPLVLGFGLTVWALLRAVEGVAIWAWRKDRTPVIWVDGQSRRFLGVKYERPLPGGDLPKAKGTWRLSPDGKLGSAYIADADPDTGWTYRIPTHDEVFATGGVRAAFMTVCNPDTYRHGEMLADWRAPLQANKPDKKDPTLLILGIMALLVLVVLGVVAWIATKVGH